MSALVDKIISSNLKSDEVRQITKVIKEKNKLLLNVSAYKKVKQFNKFIDTLENEINENHSDTLKEISNLHIKISKILGKFEI